MITGLDKSPDDEVVNKNEEKKEPTLSVGMAFFKAALALVQKT